MKHLLIFIRSQFRLEWAHKERLISPVLFSLTVVLLFSFAMTDLIAQEKLRMFLGQVFLTLLMAVQISLLRAFEPEMEDDCFPLLRTYPVSHLAFFLSKLFSLLFTTAVIVIAVVVFSALLLEIPPNLLSSLSWWGVLLLVILGICALGLLLSSILLNVAANQVLFPILFFVLLTPVLLAGIQASFIIFDLSLAQSTLNKWLALLGIFDVIYLTMGVLFYSELIGETRQHEEKK